MRPHVTRQNFVDRDVDFRLQVLTRKLDQRHCTAASTQAAIELLFAKLEALPNELSTRADPLLGF